MVLYPVDPRGAHTVLGLGAGFQSVSHFSSGVIYLCPIYKFSQSYFCKTTEGNRVATRSLRACADLQSFLMNRDGRRPELYSQIQTWVGRELLWRISLELEIDQIFFKLEMHPLRHNKHGTPWQSFQSGMYFSKRNVMLRKEQKWGAFPVNSMHCLPTYKYRAHTAVIPKLSPVLNSSLCSYVFELPLGSLSL